MEDFYVDVQRLAAAVVCSAAIGWEREWRRKPAGLRTHILVAIGAAGFVLVALRAAPGELANAAGATQVDLSRVIQGIAGGIGFLGAGTILQHRGAVEGLTTAASLWLAAALGIASGTGEIALALLVTVIALFVLIGLGALTGGPTELASGNASESGSPALETRFVDSSNSEVARGG
jgi:putative Mg2+ transporter-C (MgtC) family protein